MDSLESIQNHWQDPEAMATSVAYGVATFWMVKKSFAAGHPAGRAFIPDWSLNSLK